MKFIIKSLTCFILLSPFVSAAATASDKWSGCAQKEYQIQKQLEYAKAYGNIHRIRGLESALTKYNATAQTVNLLLSGKRRLQTRRVRSASAWKNYATPRLQAIQKKSEKKRRSYKKPKMSLWKYNLASISH